jgi:hypothetical protein
LLRPAPKNVGQTARNGLSEITALNLTCETRENVDTDAHEQGVADGILAATTCSECPETRSKGRDCCFCEKSADARGRRASGGCTRGGREEESTKTTEERSEELDHVANL